MRVKWTHNKFKMGVDMEKKKHLSLRLDDETRLKLRYIAKYEGRSINGQVMHLIYRCIRDYEAEHGEIDTKEE